MADSTVSIGILGLGRLGIGLALAVKRFAAGKDVQQTFRITGYDTDASRVQAAQASGAFDTAAASAADAAAGQDIVILTLPFGEITGGYRAIGPALRPGAVVLDFAPFKAPGQRAAAQLAQDVHVIGVTALVNPAYLHDADDDPARASADYFDKGHLLIAPGVSAAPAAVELAADFAGLLGAAVHFVDPAEQDAWMVWVEALPAALGLAYFQTLHAARSWTDVRRVGGANFARTTHHLADTLPDDLTALLRADAAGTVRALDALINGLTTLRGQIAAGDAPLSDTVTDASAAYADWWQRRQRGDWDADEDSDRPSTREIVAQSFFGSLLGNRLKRGKKDA